MPSYYYEKGFSGSEFPLVLPPWGLNPEGDRFIAGNPGIKMPG